MKKATSGWLESAKLDLENIELIKDQVHLTPIVAFHAHQAVEKSFKAVLEEKQQDVVKTHDLVFLFKKLSRIFQLDLDKLILKRLNELYIDTRYPGEIGLLPEGKPSLKDADQFNEFAKDTFDKIQQFLETKNDDDTEDTKEERNE